MNASTAAPVPASGSGAPSGPFHPAGRGGAVAAYDCSNCPAYCCSYPEIVVERDDLLRLARHAGLDEDTARRRFTRAGTEPGERVMRHVRDPIFGTACRFLDIAARRCTVYEARPRACRDHPPAARCHYYDFLMAERGYQRNPTMAVRAYNVV